jgi:hypothetical protein
MLGRLCGICVALYLSTLSLALAQDLRGIVAAAAQGLQTGNLSMFGNQARQRIIFQVGPGGVWYPMAQLGPITNVIIANQYPMPTGVVFQGRAFHQQGFSDWTLGYSYQSQKIEFGNFNPVPLNWSGQPPGAPGGPQPTPTTGGPPTTPPVPSNPSDACAKYPTLC